jgi:hypothetical protein
MVIVCNIVTRIKLQLYSLADGSLIRTIDNCGSDDGRTAVGGRAGLCMSPDGDNVLVAVEYGHRVEQIRIAYKPGSWVRFLGEGVLRFPQYVDCNSAVVVVSEEKHRIRVLSWVDGSLRAQFGSKGSGPGQLFHPRGIRLLAHGGGVVAADSGNNRLCVFTLSGEFVTTVGSRQQGLNCPIDVLEFVAEDKFVVANYGSASDNAHEVVEFSRDGAKFSFFGQKGEFHCIGALATLPNGGMVVMKCIGTCFSVFRGHQLRRQWVIACVVAARRGDV